MPSVLGTSVLAEVAGAITDFFEKLAGPEGTLWLSAFKRFLRKENPWRTGLCLNHLKLIAERIPVSTSAFARDSFFRNGPVKFWFGDNFKNWILSAIPETVPGFTVNLTQTKLTKFMSDSEVLGELGNPIPFTPTEFAAIAKSLIQNQPNGETGTLLTNGCVNIFYVQLEDTRVVAVYVSWGSRYCGWLLSARDVGDSGWGDGCSVFSRS